MERRAFLKSCIGLAGIAGISPELLADTVALDDKDYVKDYLTKIKNFDKHFNEDIILREKQYDLLMSVTKRLSRLQRIVGYANFSLLSFDDALRYARNYSQIGAFPDAEIQFLESVFYTSAKDYGFYGEKVLQNITDMVPERDIVKISRTGHYVFKGKSLALYNRIRKEVGSTITLTSGVRGLVKQMHLFLGKAIDSKGNLSMASRSLAPPGHSFHGVGDFDVGKTGFGYRNFTEDFAHTDEFKRLQDLGFISIRYHETNPFGVRYEPWHIKVI